MKRSEENDRADYTIATSLMNLSRIRLRIEEVATNVREINRINKNHHKLVIRDRSAGQNSLVAPIISGK